MEQEIQSDHHLVQRQAERVEMTTVDAASQVQSCSDGLPHSPGMLCAWKLSMLHAATDDDVVAKATEAKWGGA